MNTFAPLAAKKFWILDPLYGALGTLLAWFYSVIASYGVAIILLTLAVRIITLPLTAKQARSQQQMQRVAPELKRLQAKYKHDKQKLNEEMMRFYKENHVNPLGGCLPVLIQAPVLIVLYRLILDLTAKPDPKHIPRSSALFEALKESGGTMVSWGIDLAQSAAKVSGSDKLPYLLLVGLVVATGYYQQRQLTARVSRENINPQMAMMTKIFPVMFGFISFTIPAGVVVYFLVSNIWQIGQQAFLFRNQPAPEAPSRDVSVKDAGGRGAGGKSAKSGSRPKGEMGAGPPTKGKPAGTKGRSPGKRPAGAGSAKGGGARGSGKTAPPPRGSVTKGSGMKSPGTKSSGTKSSGAAPAGRRPSGRVTPPKRAQPAGKARPTVKGAAQPTSRATGERQRWWQKLRPAAPPPKSAARGTPRAKPKPKVGAGKGTPSPAKPSGTGRDGKVGSPGVAANVRTPLEAAAPPPAAPTNTPPPAADGPRVDPGTTPGATGNGQTIRAAGEGNGPSPAAAARTSANNGRGDIREKADNPIPGRPEAAPASGPGGATGDGEPGAPSPEAQKGDE